MSHPLIPAKPTEITLETLPQLFAHHRAIAGGWTMTATPPEPNTQPGQQPGQQPPAPVRPEGISDTEWAALGDPGQRAIVRERDARQRAERDLQAARARPTPPPGVTPAPQQPAAAAATNPAQLPGQQPTPNPGGPAPTDIASIVQQAVAAAVAPFAERDQQREADQAAQAIQGAVIEAAGARFHDTADAMGIDLTAVTDGNGRPDPVKIGLALDDLLARKPYLGKPVVPGRQAPAGAGTTPASVSAPLDDRVKQSLARMQQTAGIKPTVTT